MDPARRDPLVGRLVAQRYRVLARIARGGMATVYRAEDTRLGREIALKVMHPHLAESVDFVARFRAEARAAASLSHRNVVAVHDQGEDGDVVWLAMELLGGRTLRDQLRERGAFSPAEAFDVMQAVLLALTEAHATGLIHRDVKPENVLVARDGTYKVTDFGLARAASTSRTATGSLLGTPEYIAPETARTGQVDARVDVYSAGIVLFELLTGHQPHTGDVPFQVVWSHVTTDVPPPSRWATALPPAVDELVARACDRDPERRTQGASALLAQLRQVWSTLDPGVLDDRPVVMGDALTEDGGVGGDGATGVIPRVGALASGAGTVTLPRQGSTAATHDPGWSEVLGSHPRAEPDDHHAPDGAGGGHDHDGRDASRDDPHRGDPDGTSPTAVVPRRRRRGPGLAAVLLVLLLASLVAGAALWWFEAGPGAQREVPDLRGRTAQAGAAQLSAVGLDSSTTPVFDDVAPEGEVVDTRPGPGDTVHKNGSVVLVVSAGPELFAVPDLRGRTQEEAAALLVEADLALGRVAEAHDGQVEAGRVVSSDPGPGGGLRAGTPVGLVLSRGPAPVAVPVVTGASVEQARTALEAVGLRLGGRSEEYDDAPAGTVIAQDPAEGNLLPGGTVAVVVSRGPEPVEVPAVFEQRFDDAAATLEELGFVVQRRGSDIFGRVVSQDPPAGTELPPGSTVTVTTF